MLNFASLLPLLWSANALAAAPPVDALAAAPPVDAVPVTAAPDANQAATDDDAGEIVVVEAQVAKPGQRSVDEEEVRRSSASTIAELLEEDVGITANTGGRGERQITVRGFEQRQVAVFIDGVPTTVPYDGYLDLNKFPTSLIESMTLTPGPAAGIYGPDSLGGSIQIQTRAPPDEPEHLATVKGATYGAMDASAYSGGPVGPLNVRAGGGVRGTPGYPLAASYTPNSREDGGLRDASDGWSQDGHLRADWNLGAAGEISSTLNYLRGDYGVPTATEQDRPRYWRFSEYEDLGASVRHATPDDKQFRVQESAWYGANKNVLDNYDDAGRSVQDSDQAYHSTYRDHRVGGALVFTARPTLAERQPLNLRTWLFSDHQVHRSQGDVGEDWEQIATTLVSGALSAETDTDGKFDGYAGLEVDAELPGQGTDFEAAPLFVGPSAGLRWQPGSWLRADLGVARRARAPSLKERFSEGMGYREPNLALGPETAWHFGLDLNLTPIERASLLLSLYDAEVDGLIEEVDIGDGQVQMQNVGTARFMGAEIAAMALAPEWLTSKLALGLLDASLTDAAPPDDRLEYRSPWQVAWIETARFKKVEARSQWRWVGPQFFLDEDTLQWGRLGMYYLWDAYLAFMPTSRTALRLRVSNILDSNIQTKYGYPDAGREIWLELEARI